CAAAAVPPPALTLSRGGSPPASSAAMRGLVAPARVVLDVAGHVADLVRVRSADAHHEAVRRAGAATGDARHGILPADDVGVNGRGREHLLAVEAPAVAAELTGAAAVGRIVAPQLTYGKDRLVDLARGADEVPEGDVVSAPSVLSLHGTAVRREGIDGMVDEELPGARVRAEDDGRHAHLVDLGAAALG